MAVRPWAGALLLATAVNAHAVYTINIVETGGNVVATGSGSLNTTGLILSANASNCGEGRISADFLCTGPGPVGLASGVALTPALSGFTSGPATVANISTGSPVYLLDSFLYLPAGYVSGSPLANSSTFNGRTFASLGVTPGTRTLNLPNDTIVINVGAVATAAPTPVPTLGEYGVMALGSLVAMAGLWATRRRRL
ncbi:MAG: IPTL-CTERM sorting domain-containing protein [Acidovorax sp.]|uniref:IPTL-CTERM sorting domain-containing protein n=1 Tax=Acidovorax sp. TaxID=1872122 RepID=UPI00391AB256